MPGGLRDRFRGCLLGLALGDALGAPLQGRSPQFIRNLYPTSSTLFCDLRHELRYTGNTQMMLAVAKALLPQGQLHQDTLTISFISNYEPARDYTPLERARLEALRRRIDLRTAVESLCPQGSASNRLAIQAVPLGLCFHADGTRLFQQVHLLTQPGFYTPLAQEGAELLALAIALALLLEPFDREAFFEHLLQACTSTEFRQALEQARQVRKRSQLPSLTTAEDALQSLPTALACFSLFPTQFAESVGHALLLGGDTSALGALTAALCGAQAGAQALPGPLLALLESSPKGRAYLVDLAAKLFQLTQRSHVPS